MADLTSSLRLLRGPSLTDPEAQAPQLTAEENTQIPTGAFTRGLRSSATAMAAGNYARDALAAERSGDPRAQALKARAQELAQMAELEAPAVRSYTDVNSVGTGVDYLAGAAGGMLPFIPPVVGGAIAGRVLGPSALRGISPLLGSSAAMYPLEKGSAALDQYNDPVQAAAPVEQRDDVATTRALINAGLLGGAGTSVLRGLAGKAGRGVLGSMAEAALPMAASHGVSIASQEQLNPNRDTTHDNAGYVDALLQGAALGGMGHIPSALAGGAKKVAGAAVDNMRPSPKPPAAEPEVGPPSGPILPPGLSEGMKDLAGTVGEKVGAAYEKAKPKAEEFVKTSKEFAEDKVNSFNEAMKEAEDFPDFMRKVFGREEDDLSNLAAGDKSPEFKKADGSIDAEKLLASDEPRRQKAERYAADLMNDPATPEHVKQKVASFNGDFSAPEAQSYVANTLLGQRGGEKFGKIVKDLGASAEKLFEKSKTKAGEIKDAAGEAVENAKEAIIKKSKLEPKTKIMVENQVFDGLRDEFKSQPGALLHVKELSRILTRLIGQGASIDDASLRAFGGFHAVEHMFADGTKTFGDIAKTLGADDLYKRTTKFTSAFEDSKKPDSMLYKAIPAEKRDEMKSVNFRELARFVDSVGELDNKKFDQAIDVLGEVFGSKESARAVVDYYTRANESEMKLTDERPLDLQKSGVEEQDTSKHVVYASVDEGKNQPFHTSEKSKLADKLATETAAGTARGYTRNMVEHVRQEGLSPVDELARVEHMIKRRIEQHEKHKETTQGTDTQKEFRRKQIDALKSQLDQIEERKREVSEDDVFKGQPEDYSKDLAAENALQDFHVGITEAVDADKMKADDAFVRKARLAYNRMKKEDRIARRDEVVVFDTTDGKELVLHAPTMIHEMGMRQGARRGETLEARNARLLKDAVASVRMRDDVTGLRSNLKDVKFNDSMTLGAAEAESVAVTKKVMKANAEFQKNLELRDSLFSEMKSLVDIIKQDKESTHPEVYAKLTALKIEAEEAKDRMDKARRDGADVPLEKSEKREREEQGVTDIVKDIVEKEGSSRIDLERGEERRQNDAATVSPGKYSVDTAQDMKRQIHVIKKKLEEPGTPAQKAHLRREISKLQHELRAFERTRPEPDVERPEMTTSAKAKEITPPTDDPLAQKRGAEIPGGIVSKKSKMSTKLHEELGKDGIPVTHDSPHKFSHFDWRSNKYRGEGAMAFGAGSYFSTREGVHKGYKKTMTDKLHNGPDIEEINYQLADAKDELYFVEMKRDLSKWKKEEYADGTYYSLDSGDAFGNEIYYSLSKADDGWRVSPNGGDKGKGYASPEEALKHFKQKELDDAKADVARWQREFDNASTVMDKLDPHNKKRRDLEYSIDQHEQSIDYQRRAINGSWREVAPGVMRSTGGGAGAAIGRVQDFFLSKNANGKWVHEERYLQNGYKIENSPEFDTLKDAQSWVADAILRPDQERLAGYKAELDKLPPPSIYARAPTYHTTIKAKPEEIMDWNKSLNEQSSKVQRAMRRLLGENIVRAKPEWYMIPGFDGGLAAHALDINEYESAFIKRTVDGKWEATITGTTDPRTIKGDSIKELKQLIQDEYWEREASFMTGEKMYRKLAEKLGSEEAASNALQKAGVTGHKFSSMGGRDDKFPNYVMYDDSPDKVDINYVSFSKERPSPGRDMTPEEAQAVRDHILKTRGPDVQVLTDQFAASIGGSGEYFKNGTQRIIKVARDALNPLSVAHHESMHDFFHTLLTDGNGRKVKDALLRAADIPYVVAQMRVLLRNHPDALDQVLRDPEERLTYMYQFWAADMLRINPEATNIFIKAAKYLRGVLGLVSKGEYAEAILTAFHDGRLSEPSTAGAIIADMQMKTLGDKVRSIMGPMNKVVDTLVTPSTEMLHKTGIAAYKELAEMFHKEPGREGGEAPFLQLREQTAGKMYNKLEDTMGTVSQQELTTALNELQSMSTNPSPLAQRIHSFLDEMHQYMKDAGVKNSTLDANGKVQWNPIQYVKDYFPRVWDRNVIRQREAEFKQLLMDEGQMTAAEAKAIIEATLSGDGLVELAENEHHIGFTPYSSAVKNRQLTFINRGNAARFAEFQDKDAVHVLQTYVYQAVHRAEYARTFGNDGEKIKALLLRGRQEGATETEMVSAAKAVRAMEGTLGAEINPRLRDLYSGAIGYENIVLLPFALFSSLIDPLGVAVRSGELKDAGIALKDGVKGLFQDAFRVKKDAEYEMARTIGVIDDLTKLQAMGQVTSSMYMSKGLRTFNDKFFKWNGMETWNERMRVSAMGAGMRFMVRNKNNARYMDELGIKPNDIVELPDGKIARTTDEGLSPEQEKRVQQALYRFVDGAILRPNAAHRPPWTSDPHYMLVSHLKQYTFTFQQTILKQVTKEVMAGNAMPAFVLASYIPFMAASDLLRGSITGSIKNGWTLAEFLGDGLARSGVLGTGSFLTDAMKDASMGNLPGSSFLGPTAQHIVKGVQTVAGAAGQSWNELFLRSLPASALFKTLS